MMNPMETKNPETAFRKIREDLFVMTRTDASGRLPSPAVLLADGEMVLIGLGRAEDFSLLLGSLKQILPLDRLSHVVAPGLADRLVSVREAFLAAGADPAFVVSAHLDSLMGLSARGFRLKRIDGEPVDLVLRSGRVLTFLPAPFLLSPMAFVTFDVQGRTLFSHYLFEDFRTGDAPEAWNVPLLRIKDFLAELVPSDDFLRPLVRLLARLGADLALTETGKLWKRAEIEEMTAALAEMSFSHRGPSGTLPDKAGRAGDYPGMSLRILETLAEKYGKAAVANAFGAPDLLADPETLRLTTLLEGKALWDRLFARILETGGPEWLKTAEPEVVRCEERFGILKPAVYSRLLQETEQRLAGVTGERDALGIRLARLEETLRSTLEKMTKDPLTGHFNEQYLARWLDEEVPHHLPPAPDLQLYYLQIDNLLVINSKYSPKTGDETIRNLGILLEQLIRPDDFLVKRNGPGFILAVPAPDGREPATFARTLQNAVRNSDSFIEPITISVALVRMTEFLPATDLSLLPAKMRAAGENRIKSAALARDLFIDETTRLENRKMGRILIADREEINLRLLQSLFFNENFDVKTAMDGLAALEMAKEMEFDAILAERTIPKLDGILLKQALNQVALNAESPFLLLTYRKTPDLVRQANQNGIDAVIAKPVIFEELVGLIRRTMKKAGK